MSDITELERRITAALDRIGKGLDGLGGSEAGPDEGTLSKLEAAEARIAELEPAEARVAELEQALEDECLVSAQSEERLKAIREKSERHSAALDIQVFEHQQATAKLDSELQRLRRAAEDLRASNLSLRAALEEGVAEPHLINKAMLTELETLRATRSVEIAQADAILATLEPLAKRAAREAGEADEQEEAQDA